MTKKINQKFGKPNETSRIFYLDEDTMDELNREYQIMKIRPENLGWLKNYFSVLDSHMELSYNNSLVLHKKYKTLFFMENERHNLKVVEFFP